jgi:hypothetical protein
VGQRGLLNKGTFDNKAGGEIKIDRATETGLYNDLGSSFTNSAKLTIGSTASVGWDGLWNRAMFQNNAEGLITIDRSTTTGLYSDLGTFTNFGKITIGGSANVGSNGLINEATFQNEAGGEIELDNSNSVGLKNGINNLFSNAGLIAIGTKASVGAFGLWNQGSFDNTACGRLRVFATIQNPADMDNLGLFTINTLGAHTNAGTFNNDGVIEYPQGNPVPNVVNNDMIVKPVSSAACASAVSPALQIGGANSFTAANIWYKDAALTTQGGTYNQGNNTFTPTNLVGAGPHQLYFSVSDNQNGCPRTVSIKVALGDGLAPSIQCPANIVRSTDPGQCSAVVNYATPTANDDCGAANVALVPPSLPSGSAFPKGIKSVTWEATDGGGLTARCTFTVTVNDVQAPGITCPTNQTVGNTPGQCTATVSYLTPTASDNCALPNGQPLWVSGGTVPVPNGPNSTSTFQKGINIVQWKVTDGVGLTKTCTFRVTVNDTEAPIITCPNNIVANTAPNTCASAPINYGPITATDNCMPPAPTVIRIAGPASGANFPAGVTAVVWRAIDGAGRSSTCSFTVTVTDNQPPSITCPMNITANGGGSLCTAAVAYPTPTASDNCAGVLVPFLMSGLASGSNFPAGATTNTWRAIAPNGQTAECSFTVTVQCNAAPSNPSASADREQEPNGASEPGQQAPSLHIYPNPATTEANIGVENVDSKGGALTVFDAQGRVVWQQNIAPAPAPTQAFQVTVPVSHLPAGLYPVRLLTEGKVETKMLTVSRL